jgi:polyferredoxin
VIAHTLRLLAAALIATSAVAWAQSPSLEDLDALITADEAPLPSFSLRDGVDVAATIAFFALAMVSFARKSAALKLATLLAAIGYMGFAKGNLVSLVHVFGLIEWSYPAFENSVLWYLLMIFTLVSTVLWGRLYCGRVCAFGALTQLMDRIVPARFRYEPPRRVERVAVRAKYVVLVAAVAYFVLTGDKFIYKYIEPFWMFTVSGTAVMWTLLALLLLATVFIRNFYCRYLCSVGAALGVLSHLSVFRIKRWSECKSCKLCDRLCEWGAIQGPKISVAECVRCDDCEIMYADRNRCVHWLLDRKKARKHAVQLP